MRGVGETFSTIRIQEQQSRERQYLSSKPSSEEAVAGVGRAFGSREAQSLSNSKEDQQSVHRVSL